MSRTQWTKAEMKKMGNRKPIKIVCIWHIETLESRLKNKTIKPRKGKKSNA